MLNIKNPRVYQLARRASEITGLSMTGAIEKALERLLAAHGEDATDAAVSERIDKVERLVAAYREDPGAGAGAVEVEELFGGTGRAR